MPPVTHPYHRGDLVMLKDGVVGDHDSLWFGIIYIVDFFYAREPCSVHRRGTEHNGTIILMSRGDRIYCGDLFDVVQQPCDHICFPTCLCYAGGARGPVPVDPQLLAGAQGRRRATNPEPPPAVEVIRRRPRFPSLDDLIMEPIASSEAAIRDEMRRLQETARAWDNAREANARNRASPSPTNSTTTPAPSRVWWAPPSATSWSAWTRGATASPSNGLIWDSVPTTSQEAASESRDQATDPSESQSDSE